MLERAQTCFNRRITIVNEGCARCLFTPKLDHRFGVGNITSRIGVQATARMFDDAFDLFVHIREEQKTEAIHCVLVDEAQFLTKKQVLQLTLVVDRLKIPVLCYGLRTDFRGEPFEEVNTYWPGPRKWSKSRRCAVRVKKRL